MADEKKKAKNPSMKRFGTRYGRTVKEKYGEVEKEQRKEHKCPYCNYEKVSRKASGIWTCEKCDAKFANKAYSVEDISRKIKMKVDEKEEL